MKFTKIISIPMFILMLVGCSKNTNSSNDIIIGEQVTEEEWKQALSYESFTNFTLSIDCKTEGEILYGADYGNYVYNLVNIKNVVENGKTFQTLVSDVIMEVDKEKYMNEHEVTEKEFNEYINSLEEDDGTTLEQDGKIYRFSWKEFDESHYYIIENEYFVLDCGDMESQNYHARRMDTYYMEELFLEEGLGHSNYIMPDKFLNYYSDAEFETNEGKYVFDLENTEIIANDGIEYANYSFTFRDSKLASYEIDFKDNYGHKYYIDCNFSNYGTSKVTSTANYYECSSHNNKNYFNYYNEKYHYSHCMECMGVAKYEEHEFDSSQKCVTCDFSK